MKKLKLWLKENELGQYYQIFINKGFISLKSLKKITEILDLIKFMHLKGF